MFDPCLLHVSRLFPDGCEIFGEKSQNCDALPEIEFRIIIPAQAVRLVLVNKPIVHPILNHAAVPHMCRSVMEPTVSIPQRFIHATYKPLARFACLLLVKLNNHQSLTSSNALRQISAIMRDLFSGVFFL